MVLRFCCPKLKIIQFGFIFITYGCLWNLPNDKSDLKQTFKTFNKSNHFSFYVTL